MKRVVVYPNNSIEIDGKHGFWPKSEFQRHGIQMVRVQDTNVDAVRTIIDGVLYTVFPTRWRVGLGRRCKRREDGEMLYYCSGCTEWLPDECYAKSSANSSKFQNYCKSCQRAYYVQTK